VLPNTDGEPKITVKSFDVVFVSTVPSGLTVYSNVVVKSLTLIGAVVVVLVRFMETARPTVVPVPSPLNVTIPESVPPWR
jgi:hypothetical protein